jgi:phage terminase small subunit
MAPRTNAKTTPKPPDGLQKPGKRFWNQTLLAYLIEDPHHLRLLENACRCLDRAEQARTVIAKAGILIVNRFKELRENPACNTERQAMQVFRQTVRELGLDVVDSAVPPAPRKAGARY